MKVARRVGRPKKEPPKTETDPFAVIGKIPKGLAYQWIAETILGEVNSFSRGEQKLKNSGWSQVPATRHPQMPKKGKYIYCGGLGLYQRSKKINDRIRAEEKALSDAQKKNTENNTKIERAGAQQHSGVHKHWLENHFLDKTSLEDKFVEFRKHNGIFDVTIQIQLTETNVDSSVVVGMSLSDYAKAMVHMLGESGDRDGTRALVPLDKRGHFKICRLGFADLSKEPVK